MKTIYTRPDSRQRGEGGILLIECVVYIAVFAIVVMVGMAAFYVIWDNSMALRRCSDDIGGALRAGEVWRADVRGATGKIQTAITPDGALLKIPCGRGEINYRFSGDTVWRKSTPAAPWAPVLTRVKNSQMKIEARTQIKAWRWDVELLQRRSRVKLPLSFSFEAVASAKP
jgi:hypothetical protein